MVLRFRRHSRLMDSPRLRWIAALGVGAFLATSQPPLSFWWALPLGIAALFLLWHQAETGWRAFWTGWSAGTAYFVGTLFWIVEPFLVEPEKFAWMIPIALPAMAGGLALFWGAAFALARRLGRGVWSAPLAFATCWMAFEGLRGVVLTGFPWAQPGYGLVDVPPIQMAAYLGINGVTFLLLLVGAFFGAAMAARQGRMRVAFGVVALGIATGSWGVGAARLSGDIAPRAEPLQVGIVQPNVPQTEKWRPDLRDAHLADLLEKTRDVSARGAQVVIWPEAATPFPLAEMPDLRAEIGARLAPGGVLLAGGIRIAARGTPAQQVHNSLIAVGSDGALLQTYDKQHLVPFGEYVPFGNVLNRLGITALISLPGGFSPGEAQERVLQLDAVPHFGAMICYEAIFAHEILDRGAAVDWLVHVTNDAWFGRLAGPQQHLVQTRVRAIERGVPVARAANTGISAMIDARGQVVTLLDLNVPGTILALLPPVTEDTLYSVYEEIPFIMIILVAFGTISILNGRMV